MCKAMKIALVVLLLCGLLVVGAAWAGAASYDLFWWTVDSGGATFSSGGDYELGGTIGQPDAGTLSGGDFILGGGFWGGGAAVTPTTPTATPTSTPTPTNTPTVTQTPTPTLTPLHHQVYLPIVLRGWESVEPVTVGLMQGERWVPADTPIILAAGWIADGQEQIVDYLASVDFVVTLDSEPLPDVMDHWGEIAECGDFDEDGDTDYVSSWQYPVGILSAGTHQVESAFHLQWPVTDGFDTDEDGVPDEYSGSWGYSLQITVGE